MPVPLNKFTLVFSGKSDIGLVRTENQDSFGKYPEGSSDLYSSKGQMFIVADGMGGHRGGKEASNIALRVVKDEFFSSDFDEAVSLREAIEKANLDIFNKSGDKSEFGRMGTTCSVLVLKNDRAVIGHVGDSRIYRIENNTIEQLTNDHTKVQEMLREGLLTPEEARNYPSKSVLARALGVDERVKVDIIDDLQIKRGQSYILCSDGLAKVTRGEILQIVSRNSVSDACDNLISLANERGGKDNVTVIIVKIDPDQSAKPLPPKPSKNKKVRSHKSHSKGWVAVAAVFLVILVLLYLQYQSSGVNPSEKNIITSSNTEPIQKQGSNAETAAVNEDADSRLIAQAEQLLKEKDYDDAYIIYKSILENEPDHQAATEGIETITSVYISTAGNLMKNKNYQDALKYYKKAGELQPMNTKIKGLIKECSDLIEKKEPDTKPVTVEVNKQAPPPVKDASTRFAASGFDHPEWIYPGINKNECTVTGKEIIFTNTSSEKFVLYNKDFFEVSLSVSAEIDGSNSVMGLVIGYASPLDYYVFKYRDGGNFTLQRISGNEIQKLFEITPADAGSGGFRKLRIIYSNSVVNIYNEHGLLKSYRSVWGIFGKAGLYIDKNSSVTFKDVAISGNTSLQ